VFLLDIKNYTNMVFYVKLHPHILPSIGDSWQNQLLPNGAFLPSHSYKIYFLAFYYKVEVSCAICLFTSTWVHGVLFDSMGYNPLLSFITLMHRISQTWPMGIPLDWLVCPLSHVLITLWAFPFLCGTTRCSRFIWYIPCSGIVYFSRDIWLLLVEDSICKSGSGC
jgi:hypothetical protein